MDENLPPIREPLDPGIKLAVELLRAKGLATVDSGDGYSKEEALEAGEALPYGHVYIQVDKPENVQKVIATATIIFWPYYGYQTPTVELLARPECHTAANEPDIVAVHWPVGGLRRADTGISPFDAAGVQPTQKGGAPAELTPLEVRRLAVRDLLKSVGCRLGYSDPDAEVWWTQKGEVRRIPINGSRLSVSNQMDMLAAVERVLGIQPDVHAAPPEAAADGSPDFLDEVVAASGPDFAAKVEAAQARRGANLCGGTGQIYDPLAWEGFSGDCKGCEGCREKEPASKILDHATGPGTDGASDGKATGDAATIADLQEKLAGTIAAHNELHAMHERLLDLFSIMGIGHASMNLYDRVLTLLPRKRVTQWLSMQLAEARLKTERLRFDHPDADDSLDVIAAALAAEDEAHRRLRSYLGGPPPAPSTKVL